MTVFVPTTTVAVLRGTDTDPYGDEVDTSTAVATGIPAAVTELTEQGFRRVTGRAGVVEGFSIRVRSGVDVVEQDRLRDERSGAVYQVESVSHPQSIVGAADVRVTAARVAAMSSP
jgi:hypothetical protein